MLVEVVTVVLLEAVVLVEEELCVGSGGCVG